MKSIALAIALGISLGACIVHAVTGPRLTGTCDGACAHYVACKPGHSQTDQTRCLAECPDVFSDPDSLMGFESLSCRDAVEFVDGTAPRTAQSR